MDDSGSCCREWGADCGEKHHMDTTWHPRAGVRRTQVRLLVGGSEGQMRAPLKGAFYEVEQAGGQEVGHHENGLCSQDTWQ